MALTASACLLAAALATCAPAVAAPRPSRCPPVTFIGARGSGETDVGHDGVGAAVDEMAHVMKGALARRHIGMRIEYVHYPADSVSDFVPSRFELAMARGSLPSFLAYYYGHNVSRFLRSIDRGVRDGIRRLRRTCRSTSVVLAGYSQGAMVVHQIEQRLSFVGVPGSDALDRVAATLLLADGDRVPGTAAVRLGTAAAGGEGIRPWFYGNPPLRPLMHGFVARDVPIPGATVSICNTGDLICDFNFAHIRSVARAKHAARVHTSYATRTRAGYRYAPQLARAARLGVGWVVQARARILRPCSPPPPKAFPDIGALRQRGTTCAVARAIGTRIQRYWKAHRALPPTVIAPNGWQFTCVYYEVAKPPATDYMTATCSYGALPLVKMNLSS